MAPDVKLFATVSLHNCEKEGGTVYLISDDQTRASKLLRSLGPGCVLELRLLDGLDHGSLAGRAVVWDLDLSISRTSEAVREKLERAAARESHSIFLVSGRSDLENMQAWALGATVLISRDRAPAELPAQLSRLVAAAVKAALLATVGTLDSAFAAVALNKPVSHPQVAESASMLVNVVSDAGIDGWLEQVWKIDQLTSQHCLLVAGVVAGFALHLGLPSHDTIDLTHAAILHDVGKAKIPLSVLNKPGKLDAEEMEIVQTHPRSGWECLRRHGFKNKRVLDAVLHHHEYLDGSGYPDRLSGPQVTDFVRIVTMCDIFGALLERRAYKAPREPDMALEIMVAMGGKLDPDLLREFVRFVRCAFPRQTIISAAI